MSITGDFAMGVNRCDKCRRNIARGAKLCLSCGYELQKEEADRLRAENEKIKTEYDSAATQAAERMSQECQLLRAELDIANGELAVKCKGCTHMEAFEDAAKLSAELARMTKNEQLQMERAIKAEAELTKQRALYLTEFDRAEKLERELAKAQKKFNPDWCQVEAALESIREHMAIAKAANERAEAAEVKVKELENKFRQLHKDLGHELRDPSGTIWQEAARLQKELTKQRARAEKLERELKDSFEDGWGWKPRAEAAEAENRAILQRNAELIEERDQYKLALSGKTMCYDPDSYVKGMEEIRAIIYDNSCEGDFCCCQDIMAKSKARIAELKEIKG